MRLFRQIVTHYVFPRGSVRSVLRGPLKGYRFVVRDAMGVSFALGIDSFSWAFLVDKMDQRKVIFDIGANRGQMTLFFASQIRETGWVFSFEPVPRIAEDLKFNLTLNRLSRVNVINCAVSDCNGKAAFLDCIESETQGKLADVEPQTAEMELRKSWLIRSHWITLLSHIQCPI